MRLYRLDADAQVVGDLLVQAAGDDALEHLRLAPGELGQQRVAAGGLLVLGEQGAGLLQHALDQRHQLVFLERLLDEIHRAFLHGVDGQRHVAVAGDEGDGQGRLALEQAVLQFQAAHAVHADVDDQAGDFARVVAGQEDLGRLEAAHAEILPFEQPLNRIANGFVVVHHIHRSSLRNQTHATTLVLLSDGLASCTGPTGIQKLKRQPTTWPAL